MATIPLWFRRFIQFCGILEIFVALGFFFVEFFSDALALVGIDISFPLFYLFAAVEFLILGFLLWYSARDLHRYRVIVYASCVFRYLMAFPELITAFRFPQMMLPLVLGMAYDWGSASFTLFGMGRWVNDIEISENCAENGISKAIGGG
ncbi:MAG: hypothetical protein ACTSYI_07050 [Promethearchaeota archaeon]